jgi:hypothetical protein
MFYWNLTGECIGEWQPKSGWNSTFSEEDKIKCTNLFFFFKNKKGFKENVADIMSHMVIFKEKYHGMSYSEEQEYQLSEALKPVFNS